MVLYSGFPCHVLDSNWLLCFVKIEIRDDYILPPEHLKHQFVGKMVIC